MPKPFATPITRRNFLTTATAATLAAGCSSSTKAPAPVTSRKDRVLAVMAGETPQTYFPAAFFMHFNLDEFNGDHLQAHIAYRDYVDMDFIKVQYEKTYTQPEIPVKPSDWKNLKRLPAGFFDEPLALVKGCVAAARERDVPCIATVYSAFMCAGHACGKEVFAKHIVEDPEEVAKGLRIINEDVKLFTSECIKLGVDGFLASSQGGENNRPYPHETFVNYIKPLDLDAMSLHADLPATILHVCDYEGQYDDFTPFLDYPGRAVNCNLLLKDKPITMKEAHQLLGGQKVFMGGMDRKGALNQPDAADTVTAEARQVLDDGPRPMLLAAQCTVGNSKVTWENAKTAVQAAHDYEG